MKVYFDLCVYNRPFDDQTQPRIMTESLAVITIVALIGARRIELINSFALHYENLKNPSPERKAYVGTLLGESLEFVGPSDTIITRALELEKKGIMSIDALHVACAEEAKADYFVSCDDVLLKKLRRIERLKVRVLGLLEFFSREVA
ncbi:MAG: type II toxin-antitoxin system VapC family toxin [Syntrophobacteraceae bacterium]